MACKLKQRFRRDSTLHETNFGFDHVENLQGGSAAFLLSETPMPLFWAGNYLREVKFD